MADEFPNPFDEPEDKPLASSAPVVVPPIEEEELVLFDDQKKFIDNNWTKMDLMEITRRVFNDDTLKGTSRQGRLVRQYLVKKGYEYKTSAKEGRENLELTEENKEFIGKYAATMKPYEIARVIFKNEELHHFSKEALVVQAYIKSVSPTLLKKDDEYTDEEYKSPKTFSSCYKRIQELTGFNVEESKLNVKTRKSIEKCLEFLQAPRFVQTMTNLKNVSERAIFESEFIRSVWDKPDLTNDEINLYISLTYEYVIQDRLHRIMGKLNMMLENVTADPDGKISVSLADAIKGKSEELHRSLSRQADYTKDLTGKRSDRQKLQTARVKSLVSLVEAFRDETERKNALRFAELRKKQVANEITRLESEDEWNCRIFGISKEEILE